MLYKVATGAPSLSGRTLRKLPFLAHALFSQGEQPSLTDYLECIEKAIQMDCAHRSQLEGDNRLATETA